MTTTERKDYFAAHAPAIPEWFQRKYEYRDLGEAQHEMASPGERVIRHTWLETELEHEARWRWHYAEAMTKPTP